MANRLRSLSYRYGAAIFATILATLLRMWLDPILENRSPFATFVVAIMFAAWYGGVGPALLVLVTGALAADYFFIEPRGSIFLYDWVAYDLEHQVDMGLYFLVGAVVAVLSESLRAGRRRIEAAYAALTVANRNLQTEISEHKKAEQSLMESEQRFRGFFEQGLVGMATLSIDKGWLDVNPRLCQMLGFSEEELLRKTWSELTYADDLADDLAGDLTDDDIQFQQILGGFTNGFASENRFVRKDGAILHASVWTQCLRKAGGEIDRILVLIQDITNRKRDEQEILALNQRLREANNDLEAFTSSVCHDLRKPLFAIDGFSYILTQEAASKLDDAGREYLDEIHNGVVEMTTLIDDLMTLSRVTHTELIPLAVDLSALVRVVAESLRKTDSQRSVEFVIRGTVIATCDPKLLRVAFENLLGNAWKFTSKHENARIEFGFSDQNGQRVYFVRDDGAGFDMKSSGKIFNAFQRFHSDTDFSGTGVGLATVARIIRAHGGAIWAEAEIERGATIYFTLPMNDTKRSQNGDTFQSLPQQGVLAQT